MYYDLKHLAQVCKANLTLDNKMLWENFVKQVINECNQINSCSMKYGYFWKLRLTFCPQVYSGEEILRSLTEINFKDNSCDFYRMYINLVLTENWVLSNSLIEDNPVIYEMFSLYLRHCSTLISATNLRSYASKVNETAILFLTTDLVTVWFHVQKSFCFTGSS